LRYFIQNYLIIPNGNFVSVSFISLGNLKISAAAEPRLLAISAMIDILRFFLLSRRRNNNQKIIKHINNQKSNNSKIQIMPNYAKLFQIKSKIQMTKNFEL